MLNNKQIKTLKDRGWKVKPLGYYLILSCEDFSDREWIEICKISDEDPTETKELTVLAFGHKTE